MTTNAVQTLRNSLVNVLGVVVAVLTVAAQPMRTVKEARRADAELDAILKANAKDIANGGPK